MHVKPAKMREYFAHKLRSSLAPWKEVCIVGGDKVQLKYGLFFTGMDFVITYEKKGIIIVIIDGIYKAADLDVLYLQDTALDLRKKLLEVDKLDNCKVLIAGRHTLRHKDDVINVTGIYSHEKCFDKAFEHVEQALQLPALPAPQEVNVGCGWWRPERLRRKRSLNSIAPFPNEKYEPFAVTHAQVLALLNGGRRQPVFASQNIGITDKSRPYGTLDR